VSARIGDLVKLARIGDLVKLEGPTLIALRGIIAVYRDLDAIESAPTEVILEGGVKIRVSRAAGEFVRRAWETWSAREMAGGAR
jgi:hypothetical protein